MLLLGDQQAQPPAAASAAALDELVSAAARRFGVESRSLAVRARQQLPRVASLAGSVGPERAQREIGFCARRLRREVQQAADYVPRGTFTLPELRFAEIDEDLARPLLTHLHYLGSVRPGSRYFALLDPREGLPVALCSLSPLQWPRLEKKLEQQSGIPPERILDVSRVFAVDSAPRNCISTLLSRVRDAVRRTSRNIALLTTVVDPNLGFTGHSYRAANWQQWMTIKPRPYLYENGRFVTPRQLREQFGTTDFRELRRSHPRITFQRSRTPLLDSLLYCCRTRGATEVIASEAMPRLHR